MIDQRAEHPSAARKIADRAMGLLIDSGGEELLELRALLVEDPQRRVTSPGGLPSCLQHSIEHRRQTELGHQRSPYVQQTTNPQLIGD